MTVWVDWGLLVDGGFPLCRCCDGGRSGKSDVYWCEIPRFGENRVILRLILGVKWNLSGWIAVDSAFGW